MNAAPKIDESVLDVVLDHLANLQFIRDDGDRINWSQLRNFPTYWFACADSGFYGTLDPRFEAGRDVGIIQATAGMLGLRIDELLKAAREHERHQGRRPSRRPRWTPEGLPVPPPPPTVLVKGPPPPALPNRPQLLEWWETQPATVGQTIECRLSSWRRRATRRSHNRSSADGNQEPPNEVFGRPVRAVGGSREVTHA